jgi:hypothetical protein
MLITHFPPEWKSRKPGVQKVLMTTFILMTFVGITRKILKAK